VSWERPDPPRDEDRYYEDEAMVPASLLTAPALTPRLMQLAELYVSSPARDLPAEADA
jgi:hypothetical protein